MLNDFHTTVGGRVSPKRYRMNAERFYTAYRRVEAKAFYLSQDHVDEVNALMEDHWARRMALGGAIRIHERPLVVNPEMNDDYLVD
jgi:3-dehydroquinate synthase class II